MINAKAGYQRRTKKHNSEPGRPGRTIRSSRSSCSPQDLFPQSCRHYHISGLRPLPSSSYYLAQPVMGTVINEYARANVEFHRAQFTGSSALSFDGAWAHARRSRQCSGCFFALAPWHAAIPGCCLRPSRGVMGPTAVGTGS
jgi:hypothetical protein